MLADGGLWRIVGYVNQPSSLLHDIEKHESGFHAFNQD